MKCPNDCSHKIKKVVGKPYINTVHGVMFETKFICEDCGWQTKKKYVMCAKEFIDKDSRQENKPVVKMHDLCGGNFVPTIFEASCSTVSQKEINNSNKYLPQFQPSLHHDGTTAPKLITIIFQDFLSNDVLFAATVDKRALMQLNTMRIHVYSRTDKIIRKKGATSGDELEVTDVLVNCNQDCLLIKVKRLGKDSGVCHVKNNQDKHYSTCFYRRVHKIAGNRTEYFLSTLDR